MNSLFKTYAINGATLLCAIGLVACQSSSLQDTSAQVQEQTTSPFEYQHPAQDAASITDELSPQAVPEPDPDPILQFESVVEQRVIPVGGSNVLIGDDALAELQQLFEQVSKWHAVTGVRIIGHTDSEGSEASNQKLSVKRAQAVADKLSEFGVPQEKIRIEGKGEMEPLGDNSTVAGRANNRRVEIEVEGTAEIADIEESKQWAKNL